MSAEEFLWPSLSLNTSFYATLAALKALISRAKSRPIDTALAAAVNTAALVVHCFTETIVNSSTLSVFKN